MSVTFFTDAPLIGYRVECGDGQPVDTRIWPFTMTKADIDAAHLETCLDVMCHDYGGGIVEPVHAVDVPAVNVSNSNALFILGLLGYVDTMGADVEYLADTEHTPELVPECPEIAGEDTAEAFLGRVVMALALAPEDAGVPAYTVGGGTNVIDCGRRPGYSQDVLTLLHDLAEIAHDHNWPVRWA